MIFNFELLCIVSTETLAHPSARTLCSRLHNARIAYAEQLEIFEELTSSLLQKKHDIMQWETQIVAWEADPFNRDDPYVVLSQGP